MIKKISAVFLTLLIVFVPAFNAMAFQEDDATTIGMSENYASIGINEEIRLFDYITDSNKNYNFYTYESLNENVAVVDYNGVIRGTGFGKTSVIITLKTTVNKERFDYESGAVVTEAVEQTKTAEFVVEVINVSPSVNFDVHSILLGVGKTYELNAIVKGNNSGQTMFSSSDSSVAAVNSNGVVSAMRAGIATITCTSGEGAYDSCTVTVTNFETSISIADENTVIQKGSKKHELVYEFNAERSVNSRVYISSSNNSVLKVVGGNKLMGVKKGTATITIKTAYDNISTEKEYTVKNDCLSLSCDSAQLALDRPNVSRKKYGTSVKGRPLEAYIITNEYSSKYKKTLFIDFACHGFEDSYSKDGKKLVQEANALIEYFADNSDELANYRLIIVPCANPDGTIDGKNNKRKGKNAYGRCTAKHIDMNRDFGAFRAVESRKLRDFIKQSKPNVYLNMHGWLNETLGTRKLSKIINKTQGFKKYIPSYCAGSGYIIGWVHNKMKIPCSLVEYKSPNKISKSKDIRMIEEIIKAY